VGWVPEGGVMLNGLAALNFFVGFLAFWFNEHANAQCYFLIAIFLVVFAMRLESKNKL
jgi:hypothetical protein